MPTLKAYVFSPSGFKIAAVIPGLLALSCAVFITGCQNSPQPVAERPNIIVVMTDDQGFGDLGLNGNDKIHTPHIDEFGRKGVQFERFYVSPVCAPTRASLMTGRYYYRSGVIHTSRGGAKMHGEETTIAEILGASGYRTGIFGKWHLGDNYPMRPQDQGFERSVIHKSGGIGQAPDTEGSYFDPPLYRDGQRIEAKGYCTDIFFNAAMEFMRESADRPFFVYLPTNAPHTPLEIADRYAKPYLDMGLDETTAKVYGMVENIDENMGKLLDFLEEKSLRENTVVVFMTDNGPQQKRYAAGLRGLKSQAYEGGIRVPAFWQWPAGFEGARKISEFAAHIDVAPTLAAIAGAAGPRFDGENLLPLLKGESESWPERTLFFQCHRGLAPKLYQNAAVMTQQYKLVFSPGVFGEENFTASDPPQHELYDIAADPGESRDIAKEHTEIVERLMVLYQEWFADVRASRNFTPGVIHLGSEKENPSTLCRYQDSTFVDGKPTTWSVSVEKANRYEFRIRGGEGATAMFLEIDGKRRRKALAAGEDSAIFDLPAGPAAINVWLDSDDQSDVEVRRLD